MGSTFVTKNKRGDNKKFGDNKGPETYYLQFVPGVVLDSCMNEDSSMYTTQGRDLNSIIAHSHIKSNRRCTTKSRSFEFSGRTIYQIYRTRLR